MNIANSPQEKFTKMRRERQDWTAQYPAYFRQTRDDKEFIMFRPHQGSAALVQLVHSDVNVRSRCMTVHSVSYIPGAPLKPNQVIANEYQQYSTLRINTLECIHYAVVREHASRPIVLDVVAQSGVDKGPIIFSNGDKGWAQLETTPLVIIAKASTPCEATMIKVEAGIDPPEILRKPADPVLDVPAASGEEGASASASGKPANSASGGNTASASGGTTASAALAPEGNTASASGKPTTPASGETTAPASGRTTTSAPGGTTAPAALASGGTAAPASGKPTASAAGGTTASASGQPTTSASAETTASAPGTSNETNLTIWFNAAKVEWIRN
ncbi:hypothetical protein MGG_10615 [Pyricularia oryzae 70-15]|uniref:Uncharacterized protein n=1 Tax=Pyricularia oryzae (strain 70-15 / ATCC MYA-4617 / FGSC 8958) TaxID=242507 RepID=G4MQ13_PYRO7|nr:uncharacterized protein MGG_10615 [Pyricularia oryzae 70-15]EHA58101.1 hypothetical protein MGG_10615 [Pyricularia oryzae 70-15]KAI7909048.1 hypothetical protein M9X92_011859 [Pyricularia oryzae]